MNALQILFLWIYHTCHAYRCEQFVRVRHRSEGFERMCHICEKLARILHRCDKYVRIFHSYDRFVWLSHSNESVKMWKFARICHICEKFERILHRYDTYVRILHTSKIKHVKNSSHIPKCNLFVLIIHSVGNEVWLLRFNRAQMTRKYKKNVQFVYFWRQQL